MTEDQKINEALSPSHIVEFEKNALRLARSIILTSDWNDTERIEHITGLAKGLLPGRFFSEVFNANT